MPDRPVLLRFRIVVGSDAGASVNTKPSQYHHRSSGKYPHVAPGTEAFDIRDVLFNSLSPAQIVPAFDLGKSRDSRSCSQAHPVRSISDDLGLDSIYFRACDFT